MPNKVMVLMVECGILDVNVVFLKDLGHPMSVVLPRAFPVYSPKAVVFMLNVWGFNPRKFYMFCTLFIC